METIRRIIRILPLALALITMVACQNKELDRLIEDEKTGNVYIRINWSDSQTPPASYGMRINLFALDGGGNYGIDDIAYKGAYINLAIGSTHRTITYSYYNNNINFSDQNNPVGILAYGSTASRPTYTALFPNETVVGEPTGYLYVGENPSYTVIESTEDQYIDLWPEDRLYTYTFEIRNVKGVENISATQGVINSMANSYSIGSAKRGTTPHALCFSAAPDKSTSRIIGSFRTFGRVNAANNFTIDIRYPASITSGLIQRTWDVTGQIENETNYHIIIDGSDIEVPYEPTDPDDDNGGWDVNVDDWKEVVVPLG